MLSVLNDGTVPLISHEKAQTSSTYRVASNFSLEAGDWSACRVIRRPLASPAPNLCCQVEAGVLCRTLIAHVRIFTGNGTKWDFARAGTSALRCSASFNGGDAVLTCPSALCFAFDALQATSRRASSLTNSETHPVFLSSQLVSAVRAHACVRMCVRVQCS
jgi:hypothetical protein